MLIFQFWSNDLFNKDYIFELWPTTNMCYEDKLNAISRLIILITILGYILTLSQKILVVGLLTLMVIFILFNIKSQKITKEMINESFRNANVNVESYINPVTLDSVLKTEFKEGTKKNPFSNVLLTQIKDNPDRKSAPPSFNVDVSKDITKNVKKEVQMLNPEIKNTNKQLFGDLWENFQLDQSNRVFYSMPNTEVEPGNQSAFANYLYGNMPSSKESDADSALARVKNSYRYILY